MIQESREGFFRGAAYVQRIFRTEGREAAEEERSRGGRVGEVLPDGGGVDSRGTGRNIRGTGRNIRRKERFGGAEAAMLPAGVFQRGAAVDAFDVADQKAALMHQAGGDAVGRGLFQAKQMANISAAHTPLLRGQLQHAATAGVGLKFRKGEAPVTQMSVPFHSGEGRLTAAKKLAVGDVAALNRGDLPVPGTELI